jgi:hypothetical protein
MKNLNPPITSRTDGDEEPYSPLNQSEAGGTRSKKTTNSIKQKPSQISSARESTSKNVNMNT